MEVGALLLVPGLDIDQDGSVGCCCGIGTPTTIWSPRSPCWPGCGGPTRRGSRRIHVAGHAVADLAHPSRSAITRSGGPPITADDLSRHRQPDGELACLSACETARTSPDLADETVHLASVLHMAGYRHVIATLWPIADRPATRVARRVYTDLAAHDDLARIPAALHEATCDLHDRYPDNPIAWAAYVHIGP